MPALALHLIKIGFIALLYLFLWGVGRGIAGHLRQESTRSEAPTVAVTESPTQAGLTFRVSGPVTRKVSPVWVGDSVTATVGPSERADSRRRWPAMPRPTTQRNT